jgi:hypothetical protein
LLISLLHNEQFAGDIDRVEFATVPIRTSKGLSANTYSTAQPSFFTQQNLLGGQIGHSFLGCGLGQLDTKP